MHTTVTGVCYTVLRLCSVKVKIIPGWQRAESVSGAGQRVTGEGCGCDPWMSVPIPGCSRHTLPSETLCADWQSVEPTLSLSLCLTPTQPAGQISKTQGASEAEDKTGLHLEVLQRKKNILARQGKRWVVQHLFCSCFGLSKSWTCRRVAKVN